MSFASQSADYSCWCFKVLSCQISDPDYVTLHFCRVSSTIPSAALTLKLITVEELNFIPPTRILFFGSGGLRGSRYGTTRNLLCGHYKGIDHRIREHLITREISVGDYVLSGGELPAAILADSIIRLIPGALSDETSALSDSFQDGLVSAPIYTRPAEFNGWKVPEVLLSGNPKLIQKWQDEQAIERTKRLRPDLLEE